LFGNVSEVPLEYSSIWTTQKG